MVPEISVSYCKHKLREFDCLASRDAIFAFKEILTTISTRMSDLTSKECLKRGRKTVSAEDVESAYSTINSGE